MELYVDIYNLKKKYNNRNIVLKRKYRKRADRKNTTTYPTLNSINIVFFGNIIIFKSNCR